MHNLASKIEGNRRAFRDFGLTTLDINLMAGLIRFPKKSASEVGRIVGGWCRSVTYRRVRKLEAAGLLGRVHKARIWCKALIDRVLHDGGEKRRAATWKRTAQKVLNALKRQRNLDCAPPVARHTNKIYSESSSQPLSVAPSFDERAIALEKAGDWDALAKLWSDER